MDGIIHLVPRKLSFYSLRGKSQSPHEPLMVVFTAGNRAGDPGNIGCGDFCNKFKSFEGKIAFHLSKARQRVNNFCSECCLYKYWV